MRLKIQYLVVTCALTLSLSMVFERRAYAYADPGSSLLLFQGLSAMFTGGLFYFRKRLKSLIYRFRIEKSPSGKDSK